MTGRRVCKDCGIEFTPTVDQLARKAWLDRVNPGCKLAMEFPRCCEDCGTINAWRAITALIQEETNELIEQGEAVGEGAL